MNTETALITGASSGIGLHLAHEFAKHGHPLILVAPVAEELQAVAAEITEMHHTEVRVIAKDLEKAESAQEIYDELAAAGVAVDILVNNAGHGFRGKSWELSLEQDLSMVRLNIEAVLRMTRLFLPPMLERNRGRLFITASVAGFQPGPMLNVYHSTKAFVLSYSEGLSVELEDTEITVTALCPGPTDTDFFTKGDAISVRGFQEANLMAPQEVAKIGYQGMMDKDLIVIPGGMNKAMVQSLRFLSEKAKAKLGSKFYEEVDPADQKRARGDKELEAAARS